MPQHQDLHLLCPLRTAKQNQQLEQTANDPVSKRQTLKQQTSDTHRPTLPARTTPSTPSHPRTAPQKPLNEFVGPTRSSSAPVRRRNAMICSRVTSSVGPATGAAPRDTRLMSLTVPMTAVESALKGYFAISQICPPGSRKLAVRIPHGRSIGPFRIVAPRLLSSSHIASTVNWNRTPASPAATFAGSTSSDASLALSRFTSVPPNLKTAEFSSSKWIGRRKTS